MTFFDWLKRLGILRYGAEAAVYRNAKERPASLQMDGVLDSKKDVVELNRKPSESTVEAEGTPKP